MFISYKTLYSVLLGHFPLHFMSHSHQELFPQITICLIVCGCCSFAKLCTTLRCLRLAHRTHLSMRFSRQEYWSELPFPSPGNLLEPRIEPASPSLTGRFFTTEPPGKPHRMYTYHIYTIALPFLFPLSYLLRYLEAVNTKISASLEDQ